MDTPPPEKVEKSYRPWWAVSKHALPRERKLRLFLSRLAVPCKMSTIDVTYAT
jgi:hypothetical protein